MRAHTHTMSSPSVIAVFTVLSLHSASDRCKADCPVVGGDGPAVAADSPIIAISFIKVQC